MPSSLSATLAIVVCEAAPDLTSLLDSPRKAARVSIAGREARGRVAAIQEKKACGEAVPPAEERRTGGGGRLIVLPIVALALAAALARYFALR